MAWAELKTRSKNCIENWMADTAHVYHEWSPDDVMAEIDRRGWRSFVRFPNVGPSTCIDVKQWLVRHVECLK